jgi:hypothetical protein
MSFREIGEELGVSWQMAQKIYFRAIRKAQAEIQRRNLDV